MQQLKESSTRGGETSPLYFNSTSYKNSEVFKNVEVRKKENEEYLKVKKEEAEKRLMKDLKAQLDSVTNPDEFLKIANKIGYENLEPIQQQYALQLETNRQMTEIAKGVGLGLYDAGKDFVVGTWDFVTNPGESLEGMANSIIHPVQTYKYISKSIKDSYERDMANGNAYSRAHWVSYAIGTVATSVVGTKGAGSVTKTGVATTKTAAVKGTVKAKELSGSIANLLPYNPRNQLEMAGGVPYNAVNGAGLKDSLILMAKLESENSGTGTGLPSYGKNSVPIGPYREVDGYPIKVKAGAQEKHISNTPNYKQEKTNGKTKSILYGDNKTAQGLLDNFAGSGDIFKKGKERIEFGQPIGKYYDRNTGEYIETTKGIIHYGKDGAHIVPANP